MFRQCLSALVLVSLCAVAPHALAAQSARRTSTKTAEAVGIVNINTASAADLEALPGIGAKTAARIVEYRQKNGPFKKVEEILENLSSCPDLLAISALSAHRAVSGSRRKSQEIS